MALSLSPRIPTGTGSPRMSSNGRLPRNLEMIRQRVDAKYLYFLQLHYRMWQDNALYRLEEFDGEEGFKLKERGLRTFTDNRPRYYPDKLMEHVSSSVVNVKIPMSPEDEQQREINKAKHDFIMAALKMADKRLTAMIRPSLLLSMSHKLTLRGWYAGRCLLRNTDEGRTIVDILNWDPMEVVFDLGEEGLMWACRMTYQTYSEMKSQHPGMRDLTEEEIESNDRFMVYDYYDKTYNAVFTDTMDVKQMTRHGAPTIPVYLGYVGGEDSDGDYQYGQWGEALVHIGESCYAGSRALIPKFNSIVASALNFVGRSDQQSYVVKSPGGDKSLPDNPFAEGQEIQVDQDTEVVPLALVPMARETELMLNYLDGALQRSTLPHTAYGATPNTQISGYGIELLEGQRKGKVKNLVKAAEAAMQQIVDKLCEQFATGFFPPIEMPGQQQTNPQMVAMGDAVEVMLKPDMPGDMNSKLAAAQLARDTKAGEPLVPDSWVRSEILEIQDEEGMQDQINAQYGTRILPAAHMMEMAESLMSEGKPELAQQYVIQYKIEMMKMQFELMSMMQQAQQVGMGGQGGGMGGPPGQGQVGLGPSGSIQGVNGADTPQQVLGAPQQPPGFGQQGALVPPGQPRPGGPTHNQQGVV